MPSASPVQSPQRVDSVLDPNELPTEARRTDEHARKMPTSVHAFACIRWASGDVLPPLGFAATLPVSSQRRAQITTTLGLSSYRSAASRRDAPASISSMTRARKSSEYGLGIDCPL